MDLADGYKVYDVEVRDAKGSLATSYYSHVRGGYSFTMPAGDVTIKAFVYRFGSGANGYNYDYSSTGKSVDGTYHSFYAAKYQRNIEDADGFSGVELVALAEGYHATYGRLIHRTEYLYRGGTKVRLKLSTTGNASINGIASSARVSINGKALQKDDEGYYFIMPERNCELKIWLSFTDDEKQFALL